MNKVYQRSTEGKWVVYGYRCTDCLKYISLKDVEKHKKKCIPINTTNEKETIMPIQRIMQNGTPYYRYGNQGKLYRDKKDAEKQAQAIHASGFKEPKKEQTKK